MKVKKINLKNKKLDIGFNKKLYLDGIRQLRLVGIMGLVVLCTAAVLTAVGYFINTPGYYIDEMGNIVNRAQVGLSLYQTHWALFLTFPILVPVMTMILFSFLNHRNASDFYHAIPDTRGTLYISYVAAIFSWIGAIIGISTALSVFCISILPDYYVVWSGVPRALFLIVAACVLVMGGISIALGLTGTKMSNLLVTLIVLFLPRIFVTVVMYILADMMPFVAWEYSSSLFNPRYDLIAGLPLALFSGGNPFQYGSSGVYSLVLGLIYLAAGYVIFLRRKSESAGHAAITPRLQSAFRLIVSMTICLLPMYFIAECWVDSDVIDGDTLFVILVFYVIAVLAYFIYELMTTGKLRSFKKLCKGIGLLAGLNVALFFVIIGIYGATIKNTPEAENIDYVMLRGSESDYFEAQLQRIKIRDDEVAEITAKALKRTIEATRVNRYSSGYWDKYGNYAETVRQTVAINVGMRTIYRNVTYTITEWNAIVAHLSRLPEYYLAYCDLPEYKANEMSISCDNGNLDTSQLLKIYEVMRAEVREIDFEEWYSAIDNYYYDNETCVDTIRITLNVGNTGYRDTIRLPILFSMTETLDCYLAESSKVGMEDGARERWELILDLADGRSEKGYMTNNLSIELDTTLIGDGVSVGNFSGYIYGYESDVKWETSSEGIAKNQESFLTFIDNLFAGVYTVDPEAKNRLVINISAHGNAYEKDGDWIDSYVSNKFCISLSEPVPEELEDILGDYLEKYLGEN